VEKRAKLLNSKADFNEEAVIKIANFYARVGIKILLLIIPYFGHFIQVFLTCFKQVILFQ